MNVKELFNKKNIFKFGAWIINLRKYISFNVFSLIGLADISIIVCYLTIGLLMSPNNYGLAGWAAFCLILYYIPATNVILILAFLAFIAEKLLKFEIKQNVITDNLIYKIFFTLGLAAFAVHAYFLIYLYIYSRINDFF